MPLPVFYSRVKEARKDREICLSSQKSSKPNLSFKSYCFLEAFWFSRALLLLQRPEDVMGAPQAQLTLRHRERALRCWVLWACPNGGYLKPRAVRGQPGSHTGLGALWWEVSESQVPLNAGTASRPGEAFPKLQSPKPSPLVSDQDCWSSCHSCQRGRLQSLCHLRLSSVHFEKERGQLCEPKILKKQFWGKCDFKMTWFSLKMANCSQLHGIPSYSAGQRMTAPLRGRPSKWLCVRIALL